MINFLVMTHGTLADGLVNSASLIMGEQKNLSTLTLDHETSIEEFGITTQEKITELLRGGQVVVFTDLLLASPYNKAIECYKYIENCEDLRIISGVNLPMLLEALSAQLSGENIDTLVAKAVNAGVCGITDFLTTIKERNIDLKK